MEDAAAFSYIKLNLKPITTNKYYVPYMETADTFMILECNRDEATQMIKDTIHEDVHQQFLCLVSVILKTLEDEKIDLGMIEENGIKKKYTNSDLIKFIGNTKTLMIMEMDIGDESMLKVSRELVNKTKTLVRTYEYIN